MKEKIRDIINGQSVEEAVQELMELQSHGTPVVQFVLYHRSLPFLKWDEASDSNILDLLASLRIPKPKYGYKSMPGTTARTTAWHTVSRKDAMKQVDQLNAWLRVNKRAHKLTLPIGHAWAAQFPTSMSGMIEPVWEYGSPPR